MGGQKSELVHPSEFYRASCHGTDPNLFFPNEAADKDEREMMVALAKSFCVDCYHIYDCLKWAIVNKESGIWGGTEENQRKNIRNLERFTRSSLIKYLYGKDPSYSKRYINDKSKEDV